MSKGLPHRHVVNGVCLDRLSRDQLSQLVEAISVELLERISLKTFTEMVGNDTWCARRLVDEVYNHTKNKSLWLGKGIPTVESAFDLLEPYIVEAWESRGRKFVALPDAVLHWTQGSWNVVNVNSSVMNKRA